MSHDTKKKPLVYSCSGCSSAAQTANEIALTIDRGGEAEMSCIAGVGGDVPSLVRLAKSGRSIVVLDGCALHCARSCLKRHGVEPDVHFTLSEYGVKKQYHQAFSSDDVTKITREVSSAIKKL